MCQVPLSVEAAGGFAGGAPWARDPASGHWTWASNHVPHSYEIVPVDGGFEVVFRDTTADQGPPSYIHRALGGVLWHTVSDGPTVFPTRKKAVSGTWNHHNRVAHQAVFVGLRVAAATGAAVATKWTFGRAKAQ